MNIDHFSTLSVPILRMVLHELPEQQLCELHNKLSKKFNQAIEGYKDYPSLLGADIPAKWVGGYCLANKLSLLEDGKARFGKKSSLKECTLDKNLNPIIKIKKGLFKNLLKGKEEKKRLKEQLTFRLQDAEDIMYKFAKGYARSNPQIDFASMLRVAEKINLVDAALCQISHIAHHCGISNNVSESGTKIYKTHRIRELSQLACECEGMQKKIVIGGNLPMRFYVRLDELRSGHIKGGLYIEDGSTSLNNKEASLEFKNEGKNIVFGSIKFSYSLTQPKGELYNCIERFLLDKSKSLKKEIETLNFL